ncbi:hypothetical protein AA106556_0813 [Neokomagataea tanensis NBRC 106556]|uniref:Uncharacterized protein n=1 Tax=Neokomagataea tanensis NBRC 106556 TaxID=1223519 RepID=A0ABQ0QI31_9PROT|nr:hypothetical protein AA106556_0813 [Neokomagataea tanensis NBRC 106556]
MLSGEGAFTVCLWCVLGGVSGCAKAVVVRSARQGVVVRKILHDDVRDWRMVDVLRH